ncbi:hypothetical protein WJX74_004792 [Apatococcus lobatus]|uniref:Uncharacterized protein n=1 Tax=Apatococcus lobatus TaxID=904363 RepID=A0AAW1RS89_9CHLO
MSASPVVPSGAHAGQARLRCVYSRSVRLVVGANRRTGIAHRHAAAGRSSWESSTAGPSGFDGFFEGFDETFNSFDQRMARMRQDFEVTRQQAHSSFDDAFSQVQHLQEDAGQSASAWGASGSRAGQDSMSAHEPAEAGTSTGANGSWSMHSHSSSRGFGSSFRYESFVSIHSGASSTYLLTPSSPAQPATTPLLGVAVLVAAAYAAVAALFARGFHHTNFVRNNRLSLSAAWPLLYAVSEKFRNQFAKAFQGLRHDFQMSLVQRLLQSPTKPVQ